LKANDPIDEEQWDKKIYPDSSTSTAHKLTPRVHTLLATACN